MFVSTRPWTMVDISRHLGKSENVDQLDYSIVAAEEPFSPCLLIMSKLPDGEIVISYLCR